MVRNHNNDKIHEVAKSGEGGGSETSFPLTLALPQKQLAGRVILASGAVDNFLSPTLSTFRQKTLRGALPLHS